MTEPRTRLNRLLLGLISLMTLAIFGLGAAIVWRLFFDDATPPPSALDVQNLSIGVTSVAYRLGEGCQEDLRVIDDLVELQLLGAACAGIDILEMKGQIKLIGE